MDKSSDTLSDSYKQTSQMFTPKLTVFFVITIITMILGGVLFIGILGMEGISGLRSYAVGEGIWSKSQKSAVISILQYASLRDEKFYLQFKEHLKIPHGDKQARLELEKKEPDLELAYQGFIQGGNHPLDVKTMSSLFIRFRNFDYINRAIEIWENGDKLFFTMEQQALKLHQHISSGEPIKQDVINRITDEILINDSKFSILESSFSAALGEAARWAKQTFFIVMLTSAIIGTFVSVWLLLIVGKIIARIQTYSDKLATQGEVLTQRNRQIEESEKRFRSVTHSAIDAIISADQNGFINFWNLGAIEIFGYEENEIIGKPLTILIPQRYKDAHNRAIAKIHSTEQTRFVGNTVELPGLRKNGDEIPLEISLSSWKVNSNIYFSAVIRDISDRKTAELALVESEERYHSLFKDALEMIQIIDKQGRIIDANPIHLETLAYSRHEILGKYLIEVVHPDYRDVTVQKLNTVLSGKPLTGFRTALMKQSGEAVHVEVNAVAQFKQNDVTSVRAILRDITPQKRLESELLNAKEAAEEATKTKSKFLASMSHDIRTPMNAILGMGEVLAESKLDDDQRHYIRIINNAGEGLLALINDILDLSKIEADEIEFEAISFSPQELVENSVEIFKSRALNLGVIITTDIDENIENSVIGDPQRTKQILLNLLSNALKFTERGKIVISLMEHDKHFLRYIVSDTGIGIPENRIETIFKPFKQAESSTTRRFGGTGLGLSICQKLIARMGGKIWVKSKLDQGSTFYVDIPFKRTTTVERQAKVNQRIDNIKDTNSDGLSILLADDAEENCMVLEAFLKNSNHELTIVEDGLEAYEAFKKDDFDIVLMDIDMPVMDGYEATKKMRDWEKEQKINQTPILALTANAMKEDFEQTIEAGCNMHLSKPIRKKNLLEAINQFTAK
ncbi:MAG: PAS domain S-box protein [Magnetococcales bacterium]|nr:PAS domain S-box protein [Magnetococcales bacterium]